MGHLAAPIILNSLPSIFDGPPPFVITVMALRHDTQDSSFSTSTGIILQIKDQLKVSLQGWLNNNYFQLLLKIAHSLSFFQVICTTFPKTETTEEVVRMFGLKIEKRG